MNWKQFFKDTQTHLTGYLGFIASGYVILSTIAGRWLPVNPLDWHEAIRTGILIGACIIITCDIIRAMK